MTEVNDDLLPTTFSTVEDAVRYWKGLHDEVESEYAEYKETSAEYEHELEIEMRQLEDKLKEAHRIRQKELNEAEKLRAAHDKLVRDSCNIQDRLQAQLTTSENECQKLKLRIRKLEQESDEIEQTARRAQADIEGLNDQTEDTLEQIAYVEQENAMLVIELQHVKEQMKELQIELEVFNIRHKRKEMEQAEQLEIARAHNSMLKGSATPTLSPSLTPTPTPTSMETHTDMQGYTHTPHYTHTHTGPGSANSITGGVDAMVIDSKQPTQDNHVHTTSHTHTHAHAHTHTAAGNHIQDSSAQVNGTGGHVSEVNRTSHSDSGSRKDSVTNERHQSIRATRGSNPRTGQQSSSGSGGSSSSSSSSSSRTSKKRVSSSGGGERHYTTGDTEASDSDKGPSKLQSLADRVGKVFAPAGTALSMVNDILDRVAMIEKSLSEAQKGRRGSTTKRADVCRT